MHRRTRPSASEPLIRSRSGRMPSAGSKGAWPAHRSPGTRTPSKPSRTVTLALTAASRSRVTVSPGWAAASRMSDTMLSSGPRAATSSKPVSPHPVTQGASPSSRHPPPEGRARSRGGPGSRPPSAIAPRTSPRQAGPSHRSRSTAGVPSAASVMTRPRCCIQTNVVARQPLASSSTTAQEAVRSRPRPPAPAGTGAPYRPAAASASRWAAGITSSPSTRIASGNSTSSASPRAAARTPGAVVVRWLTGTRPPRACPSSRPGWRR